MLRATSVKFAGTWSGGAADRVVLDHDGRHRRRVAMTGVGGLVFLLDLPEAAALRGGDALALEDGRLIEVVAAFEPLAEIRCRSVRDLLRVAWHLGNRHLPAMIDGERLLIRRDHVIEEMVRGLGAAVTQVDAPFDPETGAYGSTHGHHHHEADHRPPPSAVERRGGGGTR